MQQFLLVLHLFVCLGLVGLVLVQHGKGADIGAAFGSGASNTVFGSQGSNTFLIRLTSFLAAVFFVNSLVLGYMASKTSAPTSTYVLPTNMADDAEKSNAPKVPVGL